MKTFIRWATVALAAAGLSVLAPLTAAAQYDYNAPNSNNCANIRTLTTDRCVYYSERAKDQYADQQANQGYTGGMNTQDLPDISKGNLQSACGRVGGVFAVEDWGGYSCVNTASGVTINCRNPHACQSVCIGQRCRSAQRTGGLDYGARGLTSVLITGSFPGLKAGAPAKTTAGTRTTSNGVGSAGPKTGVDTRAAVTTMQAAAARAAALQAANTARVGTGVGLVKPK
jgi:hypothetical protein